jgi:hypothetical protein
VKHLKIAILACGVIGLGAFFLPVNDHSLLVAYFEADKPAALVYAAIFVLPAVMGLLAVRRPPMQSWQAGVALASFVLGIVRLQIWDTARHLGDASLQVILLTATVVIGTLAAIGVLLKPEAA